MSDELEKRLPSVETLSERSFFVPKYQRGYPINGQRPRNTPETQAYLEANRIQ